MDTLTLSAAWDLTLDAQGNIAVTTGRAALAQNAASAARTNLGECWFDAAAGIPWNTQILGQSPSLAIVKQRVIDAALMVPGVASAQFYATALTNRTLSGQIQVIDAATGQVAAVDFSTVNPQGVG